MDGFDCPDYEPKDSWEDIVIFSMIGVLVALVLFTCALAVSPLVNKIATELVDYFF